MKENINAIRLLALEANKYSSGLEWYIFGSNLKDDVLTSDIDVLVLYNAVEQIDFVRNFMDCLGKKVTLHLTFLSKSEVSELNFIEKVVAQRIF